jgi:predicted nucleic acid-binding protein
MTFVDLAAGESVFLDANVLVYHFAAHPVHGTACTQLAQRIENGDVAGFASTAVLSEQAYRLMMFEAAARFGWPSKVVDHLKQNPAAVGQLSRFRQAVAEVPRLGIKVLVIPEPLVEAAAAVSQQTGLLSNDALIVAVMRANSLTRLASHDADFDRVPGLTRYAAV